MTTPGKLYVVATPIGNLADISLRAIETLKSVDLIAAEDTRHSKTLLSHYQITTAVTSLHQHNEAKRGIELVQRLVSGQNIALISDAGTPLISDPGSNLLAQVLEAKICIVPIPGACALITALSVAGLPTDNFRFAGFLPAKGAARDKAIKQLATDSATLIFYESVHRIEDFLQRLATHFGGSRHAVVCRELTKHYETIYRGTLDEIAVQLKAPIAHIKGEFVVLVAGNPNEMSDSIVFKDWQSVLALLLEELTLKQAVSITVKLTGARRSQVYALALQSKSV